MAFDKMILTDRHEYTTDSKVTGLNNNVMVCGTSGCGKTMSITEPTFLETYNNSLIATVTKRRIVEKYKPMFVERGYVVQDLNFVHPTEGDVGFDPLKYIRSNTDISFLAESIVMANPRKEKCNADPYWDQCAISLLSAEIAFCLETKPGCTFADVLDMHDNLGFKKEYRSFTTNYDDDFENLEEEQPGCHAVTCWNSFRTLPETTGGCVLSILNATMDTIFTPELRKSMRNKSQVKIKDFAKNKTVLFITTSPVNKALNSYINTFYSHVFKELFEYAESRPDGKLPIPVRVICDDFATGGCILNFAEHISIFREKNISVTLLLQSESQLSAMYSDNDAKTIINNCDTYLFMGGIDLETARRVSVVSNMPIEDVLWMPVGTILLMRRGQKPALAKRYNILENEEYKKVTREYEMNVEERLKDFVA